MSVRVDFAARSFVFLPRLLFRNRLVHLCGTGVFEWVECGLEFGAGYCLGFREGGGSQRGNASKIAAMTI